MASKSSDLPPSAKAFGRDVPHTDTLLEFIKNMEATNGRGIALSLVAYTDLLLELCLTVSFVQLEDKELNKIFRSDGAPLSDLSAKIKLARALGIINEEMRRQLDVIREIRNEFAHSMIDVDFDSKVIKEKCKGLSLKKLDNSYGASRPSNLLEFRDVSIYCIIALRGYLVAKIERNETSAKVRWLEPFLGKRE